MSRSLKPVAPTGASRRQVAAECRAGSACESRGSGPPFEFAPWRVEGEVEGSLKSLIGRLVAPTLAVVCALSLAACAGGERAAAGNQSQPAAPGRPAQPAPSQAAQAAPTAAASEAKVYRGAINDRGIELRLGREGERLTGSYSYDGSGGSLRLEGRAGADGKLTLSEFDPAGKQTGKFDCEAAKAGDWEQDLSCDWSKPDGGGGFHVALYEQHSAFKSGGLRVEPKVVENRGLRARASYPQLAARAGARLPPAAVSFNRLVEKKVGELIRDYAGVVERGQKNLYYRTDYNVLLATDDLISVELSEDSYSGGAHPSFYYKTVTYDLRAGRELKLGELFKPGSGYERALRDYAHKQINERAAGMDGGRATKEGGEPVVAAEMLGEVSGWGLTPRGLMVYYDLPHVIAAFQRSSVPFDAIRDHLRPDGPAAPFARP